MWYTGDVRRFIILFDIHIIYRILFLSRKVPDAGGAACYIFHVL